MNNNNKKTKTDILQLLLHNIFFINCIIEKLVLLQLDRLCFYIRKIYANSNMKSENKTAIKDNLEKI